VSSTLIQCLYTCGPYSLPVAQPISCMAVALLLLCPAVGGPEQHSAGR
jgi:hypothetical protein